MENAGGFWRWTQDWLQALGNTDVHEYSELNSGGGDVMRAAAEAVVRPIARLARFVSMASSGDFAKLWRHQITRKHFNASEQGETQSNQTNQLAPAVHSGYRVSHILQVKATPLAAGSSYCQLKRRFSMSAALPSPLHAYRRVNKPPVLCRCIETLTGLRIRRAAFARNRQHLRNLSTLAWPGRVGRLLDCQNAVVVRWKGSMGDLRAFLQVLLEIGAASGRYIR